MAKKKHNVLIPTGHIKQIEKLSGDQAKKLLLSLCAYQEEQEMPELDPVTDMLFSILQDEIDENTARYEETCKKRKAAAGARWESDANVCKDMQSDANDANACKSMQTMQMHAKACKDMQSDANVCKDMQSDANDADSDSDNDSDNDIDIVSPNGDKEKRSAKADPKKKKHKHGFYGNVLLTDDELEKLKDEIPEWKTYLENLSEYIAQKGDRYKSHYATIRAWWRKDKKAKPVNNVMSFESKWGEFLNDETGICDTG